MIFKFAFLLSLVRFNLFHVFLFIDISSFDMYSYIPLSIFLLETRQAIFVFLLLHIHFNNSTSSAQNKFWVNILCLKFFTLRHGFHINETIFNVLINHWRQFSSSGQSNNYGNEIMNIQFLAENNLYSAYITRWTWDVILQVSWGVRWTISKPVDKAVAILNSSELSL